MTEWILYVQDMYSIAARMIMGDGTIVDSDSITFAVIRDLQIELFSPTNDEEFTAPASVPLKARLTDGVSSEYVTCVKFYQDGRLLNTVEGPGTDGAWGFDWEVLEPNRYENISAVATMDGGQERRSAMINIDVVRGEIEPMGIAIVYPEDGAGFTPPASVLLSAQLIGGTPESVREVCFYREDDMLGVGTAVEPAGTYEYNWTGLSIGQYDNIYAHAFLISGEERQSDPINIIVIGTDINPTGIRLTSPANGAEFVAPASVVLRRNSAKGC